VSIEKFFENNAGCFADRNNKPRGYRTHIGATWKAGYIVYKESTAVCGLNREYKLDNETSKKSSWKKFGIIAGIIVVLILALLIFGVPRWRAMRDKKLSAEAKTSLEALKLNLDDYWKTNNGVGGYDITKALNEAKISPKVRERWDFVIAWKPTDIYTGEMMNKLNDMNEGSYVYVAPYRMIMAVARVKNPVGEGVKLWFSGDENQYHGFGLDDKVEPNWSVIFPNP